MYLQEIKDKLTACACEPENWDSYGGVPLQLKAHLAAVEFAEQWHEIISEVHLTPEGFAACTVLVHGGEVELEIEDETIARVMVETDTRLSLDKVSIVLRALLEGS